MRELRVTSSSFHAPTLLPNLHPAVKIAQSQVPVEVQKHVPWANIPIELAQSVQGPQQQDITASFNDEFL